MLPRLVVPWLLLLPLAGCLGGDAPAAEESADPASATQAAQVLGGDPAAEGAPDAVNATRVVPIAFDGSLPTYLAPCAHAAIVGQCVFLPPGASYNNRLPVAERGNLTGGTLTVTWTATSPLTEELWISFFGFNEDDYHEVGFAGGVSPLVLEVEAQALDPSMEYGIYVGPFASGVNVDVAGVGVRGARDQAFRLEGSITFSGPAP